jgi:hypothetical protein
MNLERIAVSDTVTRYLVTAHLGPDSDVLLVRPDDGQIIAGWSSTAEPSRILGEWVSPYDDLVGVVRGTDLDGAPTRTDVAHLTSQEPGGPPLVA